MVSPSPTPQLNAKRYWGDEKNIDSIYSIYLKKISYANNNDISLSATYANSSDRRNSQDDSQSSHSASSNDLARFALQNCSSNSNNIAKQQSNRCQKPEESPRGRRNFFQKYRRRSCSVDKYTFDRQNLQQQKQQNCSTPVSGKSKNMRFLSSSTSKKASQIKEDLCVSHDVLDCSLDERNGRAEYSHQKLGVNNNGLQKSMNELSSQLSQSLQWETRQIKVLQAATLDHALKFILLINSSRDHLNNKNPGPENGSSPSSSSIGDSSLEEERNNVAHIVHVMFCTYRIYTNPYELMLKLMDYSDICRIEQYRFVMHYWMDNYPEDFDYIVEQPENSSITSSNHISSLTREQNSDSVKPVTNSNEASQSIQTAPSSSNNHSITSFDSSITTRTAATSDSDNSAAGPTKAGSAMGSQSDASEELGRRLSNLSLKTTSDTDKVGIPLIVELLRLCRDDYIRDKALKLNEMRGSNGNIPESGSLRRGRNSHHHAAIMKNSAVLDLDSRYVAQQLTAIDLENFLSLKTYSLLEGTKSDKRIQNMVKNFNLLSRHVVVTTLKSHSPHIVVSHWIAIAMNLRKMKNFNSLKAIIAGLTNESVYRLKQMVWSKIDRNSLANFKTMASIVDDVNNQTVLRQTQLIVEGMAKMSIEDDSFGTIPYLGTFLTDLNMIDARYQTYVPSPKDETLKLKLINFEKCAKQFEILTQVQLLQKNVLASLHAIQRRNHFDEQTTLNKLRLEFNQNRQMLMAKPAIPQVARLFENWFYDNSVATMTDKQCYEISVTLEPNVISR